MIVSGSATPGFAREPIVKATFLRRPNRFVVLCRLGKSNVRAYLPNPGRLRELLLPGCSLFLLGAEAGKMRSTDFTVVAVERKGRPVLLHTHYTNIVARWLLDKGLVPGLEKYRVAGSEVSVGRSRFDFLLEGRGERMLLEVKSCTLFGGKIAMFPDAVTARGRRHVLELVSYAEEKNRKAGVLFVIHWPKARYFLPDYHTDPDFSGALAEARGKIVIKPMAVGWKQDLSLSTKVREAVVPWRLLEREDHDGGSYILLLRLVSRKRIQIGGLGKITFEKGYYLYAGSAAKNLAARLRRHGKTGKKAFWHIDYLREDTEFHGAFPIRSRDRLECRIAAALDKVTDWGVPGFGSSDCSCRTHLYGLKEDPLRNAGFVDLIIDFRIDRLLKDPSTACFFDAV